MWMDVFLQSVGLGALTPFSAICIGTGMVSIKPFCSLYPKKNSWFVCLIQFNFC